MIDIKRPEQFASFQAWIQAVCAVRGMQATIAQKTGSEPQAVTKWLKGGSIKPAKLKALAAFVDVDYMALRMLLDGVDREPKSASEWPVPKTQLGANVGRKWEELEEPARTQILNVLETLVTLQRDSYRKYVADQEALVARRPGVKALEKGTR